MELSWFGRYRETVANLIYFSNAIKLPTKNADVDEEIHLSVSEWQVLEVIIESEHCNSKMVDISNRLCIPQSTITVIAKSLQNYGLIERFKSPNNKKNIFLKPTEKGKTLYNSVCENRVKKVFSILFDKLDRLDDEQLIIVNDAIKSLSNALVDDQCQHDEIEKLIKVE